jgi:hypothetical protein
MRGDVLWPLLFGSALTLVTTLVAQWSSLAYQTKRQREMRRADFQRTTLLQLRDTVAELAAGAANGLWSFGLNARFSGLLQLLLTLALFLS